MYLDVDTLSGEAAEYRCDADLARIILCLATLELWLPDMYNFVVFLLPQKTNWTVF